jgi:hypothetical protein
MRLVTLSGNPSHNQHLNLRRVTELPRLQPVCARVKDFFSRSGCEGAVATRSSCGAVVMTRIIKGFAVDWGGQVAADSMGAARTYLLVQRPS